ncbi:MAG: hypothetical protein QM762_14435 [Chryseolinea sp.]
MQKFVYTILLVLGAFVTNAQSKFDGLDMNLSNLSRVSDAKTRSISPENFTGEKGKGALADPIKQKGQRNVANAANEADELGVGWKVNPFIVINSKVDIYHCRDRWIRCDTTHLDDTNRELAVFCHPFLFGTMSRRLPSKLLSARSFGMAWNQYAPMNSLATTVNPGSAFNSYWKIAIPEEMQDHGGEHQSG